MARIASIYSTYHDGWPTIINSIVWGQTDDINNVPEERVRYTDTGDSAYWNANYNLWSNPDFIDPLHRDCRVAPTSPVIDAGNSTATDLPLTDLDGNPRVMSAAVDMGAYESPIGLAGSIGSTPESGGRRTSHHVQPTDHQYGRHHSAYAYRGCALTARDTDQSYNVDRHYRTGSVWSQAITATVVQGYEGSITNTLQVTSLEGPNGFFAATAQALIPISGLSITTVRPY